VRWSVVHIGPVYFDLYFSSAWSVFAYLFIYNSCRLNWSTSWYVLGSYLYMCKGSFWAFSFKSKYSKWGRISVICLQCFYWKLQSVIWTSFVVHSVLLHILKKIPANYRLILQSGIVYVKQVCDVFLILWKLQLPSYATLSSRDACSSCCSCCCALRSFQFVASL